MAVLKAEWDVNDCLVRRVFPQAEAKDVKRGDYRRFMQVFVVCACIQTIYPAQARSHFYIGMVLWYGCPTSVCIPHWKLETCISFFKM